MKTYGVLVVDDSAVMRKIISTIIEACPDLFVIGKARNGIDAIEKVQRLKPDIVTLDIEMPVLNGLETLKILMQDHPIPVVMLTNGENSTIKAFELGAIDFIEKKKLTIQTLEEQVETFNKQMVAAANATLQIFIPEEKEVETDSLVEKIEKFERLPKKKEILFIGSSTGGPRALQEILPKFPSTLQIPIVVVQHMPVGFTKALADRFDGICNVKVKEVEHNEKLLAGVVYIAPAGSHTLLQLEADGSYKAELHQTTTIESLYKPSIDVTLMSFAKEAKKGLLTVILTGMGDDGLRGCREVKEAGGIVLAEAEESCIVYGMPKVVYTAGLVHKQVSLMNMYEEINRKL